MLPAQELPALKMNAAYSGWMDVWMSVDALDNIHNGFWMSTFFLFRKFHL